MRAYVRACVHMRKLPSTFISYKYVNFVFLVILLVNYKLPS